MDGRAIEAMRPEGFFRKKGRLPEVTRLQLTRPPSFEDDPGFVERLREALREAEDRAAADLGEDGRSFLGVARVLAQHPRARPAPGEPRRGLKPRVACRAKWKRIEALQRLDEFASAYRTALEAWRVGVREALFPAGTWLTRVQHSVRCAGGG